MMTQWAPCTWYATSASMAVSVALAISATTGCAATAQAGPERGTWSSLADADERDAPSAPENPDVRGMSVKNGHGHPGQLNFDHSLQVRRSITGVPHELHDGDQVMAGDRIRVSVQTSVDAYLYLAFCSHHQLTLYPPQGALRTQAGVLMVAPTGGKELEIDDDPGREVLYVIVSAQELSVTDPTLAEALAAKSSGGTPTDCGASLGATFAKSSSKAKAAKPPASSSQSVRDSRVPKEPQPPTSATQGSPTIAGTASPTSPPPVPDFQRNPGANVRYRVDGATGPVDVVAANDDGIAVVRHTFMHVAAASPPQATASARRPE